MNEPSMTNEYISRRIRGFQSMISSHIRILNDKNRSVEILLDSGLYKLEYNPESNWRLVTLYDYEGIMFKLYHGLRYEVFNKNSTVYFFEGGSSSKIQMKLLWEVIKD